MQHRIVLIFLLLTLATSGLLQAQRTDKFTRHDEAFISELNELIMNIDRQDRIRAQAHLDTFAILWKNGHMLETQKEWVYNTMDAMLGMRLRPWPDYALYLQGVVAVLNTQQADLNFDNWHRSFENMLNIASQRRLLTYWHKSLNLFNDNIVFSSSNVTWQLKTNRWSLTMDEDVPAISFSNSDVACYSQRDSTIILNTSGKVFPLEDKLQGTGGRFTWERVELDPERVYATLKGYTINLNHARFEMDSVTFYNFDFFSQPLQGRLQERLIAEVKPENARYPSFQSYQAVHEIRNLFQGIDFLGGFTMLGQRILGSGTEDADATIKFYRADSLFITARSSSFSIRQDRIISDRAAVSIYLSGDSIYHPSINMRYLNDTREFSLQREEQGFSRAPFINTFHKLDMYCEAIYWITDTYDIELRMIRGMSDKGSAVFESHDFFSDLRYMRMQGISNIHPLVRLRTYAREYGSNEVPLSGYARFLRQDEGSVLAQILNFSYYGFVSYDADTQTITLQDRISHYIMAYAGRADFDVIQVSSHAPVNARLNMNNFDLHLYGVERIPLSDQKNVVIHPYEQEVVMKKNRDMYFNGRIESGLFDFYGKEFFFDYDNFKIDLVNTDSMSFSVRSFDADSRGRHSYVRVRTVLEGINGELLVDHPSNKSGQLPYPRYPIFNSDNESYVYYDREFVQSGVYKREDVYFRLIPFSIDSLDHATTDNIAFDGVFISTGIFPDFYDFLTVQPDYSLGFNTRTPDEGYPVYDGKALYKGPIDMSYEGLRADGRLEYLSATLDANSMLMFPDSARAKINTFTLDPRENPVEYPEIAARDINMLYKPFQDNMHLAHTTHPMKFFGDLASLSGSIELTPSGLTGEGKMDLFGASLMAKEYDFKRMDFSSNLADMDLNVPDKDEVAFRATGYESFVDMKSRSAEMKSIEGTSKLAFLNNRFDAYGFDYEWDMPRGDLAMANTLQPEIAAMGTISPEQWIQYDFAGKELISTHPAQDSLKFYAGTINYNPGENVIYADYVKIIKVADAAVYPHNEQVQILPRAEISKLENAMVLANTYTLHHRFYDADINIASRWNYAGSGKYDFVDETGAVQPIHFETINVDRAYKTTFAKARIEPEHDFTISPRFGFMGDVELQAENPDFFYKGAAQIFVDCPDYQPDGMRFEARIKKDSIFIPLQEDLRNEANGRILSSIMLAGDSIHIYPALFGRRKHYSDIEIINATGYLTWDRNMSQYQVSTAEKFANSQLPDNIISINPNTCIIDAHGNINLSEGMGQFGMNNYGRMTYDLNNDNKELDIVMGINFFFLDNALASVEKSLRSMEEPDLVNLNRHKYTSYLAKKTGEENARRLMEEFILGGSFRRFPTELENTFFFADLRMRWDQSSQTFYSTAPLGIGNMERFPLNLYVNGYLELRKHRGGDIFNMVLVPSGFADEGIGREWFFFTYANGIMQTIASDNEFNNMIRSVSPRRRRMDVERGEQPFTYILSSDRRPFDFVRTMKMLN